MKTDDMLRWGVIGGVLLMFCIPLLVFNSLFFPFITGKGFAFRILVESVFALWVILAMRDPSVRPKKSYLLYAIGAFLLSLLVSVFFAVNPDKAFWSNFERMEGWITILHLALYFTVVFSLFTSEKFWKILWNFTIAVSVIEALYGLCQLAGWVTIHQGGVRLDGTFGNATYLAVYMLMHIFITTLAWIWWARGKGTMSRALAGWYGVAIILQLVILFYTATRGAQLGLIGGLFVAGIAFLISGRENKWLRNWGIGALVALVVLAAGFSAIRNTPFVQQNEVLGRLASIATPEALLTQGSTRFAIWGMAIKGFEERPVFGWGQEGFNYVFNKYYQPSLYGQESWFDRAHNEFLDMLIAGGVVGFLLYLSLFALALWYLWRRGSGFDAAERGLFTGLLVAYAINNLVVFDNLLSYVLFFTVLAYIAYRAHTSGHALYAKHIPQSTQTIAAPLIVVAMAVVLYFVNVPGIATATDIIQGLSPHSEGITANFDYFKKAVADSDNGGLGLQEVREQLVQFALQVKSLNAGDAAFQQSVVQYAATQMQSQARYAPQDARIRVLFGTFLLQFAQYDDARVQLLAAHDLSPNKQAILFQLGALELSAGNPTTALSWLKQAYDLAPTYDDARITYAAGAIRTGNMALASSLLMPRFGTVTPNDPTLLAAYVAVKDWPHALAILKGRVDGAPSDAQAHIQLAAGYHEAGDNADAILELQKAMQLNPSFQAQGQSYIDAIRSGAI